MISWYTVLYRNILYAITQNANWYNWCFYHTKQTVSLNSKMRRKRQITFFGSRTGILMFVFNFVRACDDHKRTLCWFTVEMVNMGFGFTQNHYRNMCCLVANGNMRHSHRDNYPKLIEISITKMKVTYFKLEQLKIPQQPVSYATHIT